MWGVSVRSLQKSETSRYDFIGLLEEKMEKLNEESLLIFVVTVREIWKRRN